MVFETYLHLKQNLYFEDFRSFCLFITIADYMKSDILPTMEDYLMKLISLNIVLKQAIHGITTDLGMNTIRSIVLPVQSLDEQNIIAAKIEKLLALCDQLETQISQNQTNAEQLMQAVLKEAFSHNSISPQATANTLEGAGA